MATPKCFVSRWKVQRESSGRRKTREERHCEASGGAAGFRASRVLRGGEARARHGEAQGFRLAQPIRLAHAPRQQSMTSALAHALKEWLPSSALRKRPDLGAGWKPVQAGALSGKLTEPANTLYALEAEGQKGGKKEEPPSLPCHQASMAVRLQGGALLPESAK